MSEHASTREPSLAKPRERRVLRHELHVHFPRVARVDSTPHFCGTRALWPSFSRERRVENDSWHTCCMSGTHLVSPGKLAHVAHLVFLVSPGKLAHVAHVGRLMSPRSLAHLAHVKRGRVRKSPIKLFRGVSSLLFVAPSSPRRRLTPTRQPPRQRSQLARRSVARLRL